MSTLANHMRITGLQVSNDDVDSRKAAITSLKTAWNKITTVDKIFVKAADVAAALGGDGTPRKTGSLAGGGPGFGFSGTVALVLVVSSRSVLRMRSNKVAR